MPEEVVVVTIGAVMGGEGKERTDRKSGLGPGAESGKLGFPSIKAGEAPSLAVPLRRGDDVALERGERAGLGTLVPSSNKPSPSIRAGRVGVVAALRTGDLSRQRSDMSSSISFKNPSHMLSSRPIVVVLEARDDLYDVLYPWPCLEDDAELELLSLRALEELLSLLDRTEFALLSLRILVEEGARLRPSSDVNVLALVEGVGGSPVVSALDAGTCSGVVVAKKYDAVSAREDGSGGAGSTVGKGIFNAVTRCPADSAFAFPKDFARRL